MGRSFLLLAFLFVLTVPASAPAQRSDSAALVLATNTIRRIGAVHVVTTAPVIDGRLDDAAWGGAAPYTGFVQRELHEGDAVSERTEVRILSDGEALYIGAWLYDRDPGGILSGVRESFLTDLAQCDALERAGNRPAEFARLSHQSFELGVVTGDVGMVSAAMARGSAAG